MDNYVTKCHFMGQTKCDGCVTVLMLVKYISVGYCFSKWQVIWCRTSHLKGECGHVEETHLAVSTSTEGVGVQPSGPGWRCHSQMASCDFHRLTKNPDKSCQGSTSSCCYCLTSERETSTIPEHFPPCVDKGNSLWDQSTESQFSLRDEKHTAGQTTQCRQLLHRGGHLHKVNRSS